MISRKTKYGIKALIYIYKHQEKTPIPIANIANAEAIPHKFLEAILLTLRKGGILAARKGKNGGYYLRKQAEDVLMADIIRLLNGPIALLPCTSLNFYEKCEDCPDENLCAVNRLMVEVRDSTLKILRSKNLAQLAEEPESKAVK